MLIYQQWSGEPEAGRGSRCRKNEVLGSNRTLITREKETVPKTVKHAYNKD